MEKYQVTGMSCAACSAHVEKAVRAVDGVDEVAVSLLTNSMTVEGSAAPESVIRAVEKAGYGASLEKKDGAVEAGTQGGYQSADTLKDTETPKIAKRLIASVCFLIPLMYISMGHMMWNWPVPEFLNNHVAIALTQLLFTVVIMVINQHFFVSGWTSAIHGAPNMDTLVALGSAASFGYSIYAMYAMGAALQIGDMELAHSYMHEFYFESAAMILTLITVGKMLESYSKGRTTDALKSLMNLAPKQAVVLRDGAEVLVPVEQVAIGDVFVVKPGESVPVDGVIIEGNSALDESALTGESIPVDKKEGDTVSAATINRAGYLKCRATRVGVDTTLSQIIQMVSDAAATKAPIAKVADKVSGVFVPVVIGIAAVTILAWLLLGRTVGFALARGISVLVISCPCALGLATPVAIMVGNGIGARNGILFKNAVALENTGKADIVVMDKTGTLTTGKPVVTDVLAVETDDDTLLSIACSLEAKSEHPLAHAVVSYGKKTQTKTVLVEDFAVHPGNGLSGRVDGREAFGGNLSFIETKLSVPESVRAQADVLAGQGKTPVYFAQDGRLLGIIGIADVLKANAKEAVERLHHMGKRVIMLTGDNERTAQAIAREAGVDQVIANVLPQDKEANIRRLKEQGRVIMVGDGINDAPALTRADIGIAIGAGTDVAIDAADVVLMKSDISDVPAAIHLSHKVLKNIHENLFWAFFYNVIGIPLAAGVWIPLLGWKLNPMFGAAAMSLSSFCVVTNALRLNLMKLERKTNTTDGTAESIEEPKNTETDHNCWNKTTKVVCNKEDNKMKQTLVIEGMMCGHCQAHVAKALNDMEGVNAEVSFEKGTAEVETDRKISEAEYAKVIEEAGYKLKEVK